MGLQDNLKTAIEYSHVNLVKEDGYILILLDGPVQQVFTVQFCWMGQYNKCLQYDSVGWASTTSVYSTILLDGPVQQVCTVRFQIYFRLPIV